VSCTFLDVSDVGKAEHDSPEIRSELEVGLHEELCEEFSVKEVVPVESEEDASV
jgi:hypothetical protein